MSKQSPLAAAFDATTGTDRQFSPTAVASAAKPPGRKSSATVRRRDNGCLLGARYRPCRYCRSTTTRGFPSGMSLTEQEHVAPDVPQSSGYTGDARTGPQCTRTSRDADRRKAVDASARLGHVRDRRIGRKGAISRAAPITRPLTRGERQRAVADPRAEARGGDIRGREKAAEFLGPGN